MSENSDNKVSSIFEKKLAKMNYVLLSGSYTRDDSSTTLYNHVFKFWRSFWDEVMVENRSSDQIDSYDFFRSHIVAALLYKEEVVSVHLYSFFNLNQAAFTSHPYFRGENERVFIDAIRERGGHTAMSLEYLTINKDWRKSRIGFSLSPVVVGLGYKIQEKLNISASLGRSRQDLKVQLVFTDVGGVILKSNVLMHNTPIDYCATFLSDIKPHPDQRVRKWINDLWNRRSDLSEVQAMQTNTWSPSGKVSRKETR